jgi:alpha-tubulin suppressor-like RCC1 family protein
MPNLRHAMMAAAGSAGGGEGSLWTWGSADSGKLGTSSSTKVSSPLQVGTLETWTAVFSTGNCMFATKDDGTLWGWGRNNAGQVGDVTVVYRSSPVQVGSLTDWAGVQITGSANAQLAIKSDNTLWSWGGASQGTTCQNDTISRSSPHQVGALTNWSYVKAGH